MTGRKVTLDDVLTPELVEALVLDLGKNVPDLVEAFGCSERTIRRKLREYGLLTKVTQRPRKMVISNAEHIAKVIRKPDISPVEFGHYEKEPEKESVHILISDIQTGQKLPTETTERAKSYFVEAFDYFTENILKVLSTLKCEYHEISVHLNGDLLEGEGIYSTQAYDSFHLRDQMEIGYRGLVTIIEALRKLNVEKGVSIYSTRGNHGRTGWKTSDESNWDTVLAKMIEARYEQDDDVNVVVCHKKHLVSTNAFGWNFMQTHGDYIPMYMNLPYYGMDKMIGGWVNIYERIEAVLIGHFHVSGRIRPAGIPAFLNGCWRVNDFPIEKMARVPTRCQWMFGSSESRPITWAYEVDTEPPKYKNDLNKYLLQLNMD